MPLYACAYLLAALASGACDPGATDTSRLGGAATVRAEGVNAFGFASPTLSTTERRAFAVGNAFFKDNWVAAPASTEGRDGLGPFFNARSCSACHLRDGRGKPPSSNRVDEPGLLVRVGVAGEGADRPHAVYGGQIQDRSVAGVPVEARILVERTLIRGALADGSEYELESPRYSIVDPGFGPLEPTVHLGPRIAPQMIGLGLLEAIRTTEILAGADPEDADNDGISGRAHMVVDLRSGERVVGRFGWKATQPSVEQQVAAAFLGDLGITSSLHATEDVTATQRERFDVVSGGEPELSDHKLQRVTFYSQVLAVPAQRNSAAPEVRAGRELFDRIGCASCHKPSWTTGEHAEIAGYSGQLIHPFTDLLLHDMGPALADEKFDGDALPGEWRTPPLWGIGLFEVVNGHTRYLHDGRARNLEEAVLWHAGEGLASRERYEQLASRERAELLAFLRSL